MTYFLTPEELGRRLSPGKPISVRTIQRWARERKIPSVKLGRSTLFTEDQVGEIAKAYTREPQVVVPEHELQNPAYRERMVVVPMRRPNDAA